MSTPAASHIAASRSKSRGYDVEVFVGAELQRVDEDGDERDVALGRPTRASASGARRAGSPSSARARRSCRRSARRRARRARLGDRRLGLARGQPPARLGQRSRTARARSSGSACEVAGDRRLVAARRGPGERGTRSERGDVLDRGTHEVEVRLERHAGDRATRSACASSATRWFEAITAAAWYAARSLVVDRQRAAAERRPRPRSPVGSPATANHAPLRSRCAPSSGVRQRHQRMDRRSSRVRAQARRARAIPPCARRRSTRTGSTRACDVGDGGVRHGEHEQVDARCRCPATSLVADQARRPSRPTGARRPASRRRARVRRCGSAAIDGLQRLDRA